MSPRQLYFSVGAGFATAVWLMCGWLSAAPQPAPVADTASVLTQDGRRILGVNVQAGVWVSQGNDEGCKYGTTSPVPEITAPGVQTVVISSGDKGFSTYGCNPWYLQPAK